MCKINGKYQVQRYRKTSLQWKRMIKQQLSRKSVINSTTSSYAPTARQYAFYANLLSAPLILYWHSIFTSNGCNYDFLNWNFNVHTYKCSIITHHGLFKAISSRKLILYFSSILGVYNVILKTPLELRANFKQV